MTDKKLYLAEGVLEVKAKGYWFTSGGQKGSFGYYPHLKDKGNYPLFPDTQLHCDLRMAAEWLLKLKGENSGRIKGTFGSSPSLDYRDSASRLYLTDLELSDRSKGSDGSKIAPPLRGGDEGEGEICGLSKWSNNRFEIKARTEIEDATRTVKEHMLVSLEMSYLEGLELEAKVYLGYYESKAELEASKDLLNEAAAMLSGFGAYRSRGYGRGVVSIAWNTEQVLEYNEIASPASVNNFTYALTALANFRNKQLDAGSTQLLVSRPYITAEQLRGWFAKTYNRLFGVWPDMNEIASITFPALYPSLCNGDKVSLGYPPAMSTLKTEEEKVKDMAGRAKIEGNDKESGEAFFATKTKPLQPGNFVTDEIKPQVMPVSLEKRTRNSIDEKFTTRKEGGLFVQELIGKGTGFGGIIKGEKGQGAFAKKADFIFLKVRPIINGCLFEAKIYAAPSQAVSGRFRLVVEPVTYSKEMVNFRGCGYEKQGDRIALKDANQVTLTTIRTYNTTLKRPRRPRIVIAPGAVICDSNIRNDKLLDWQGFEKDFKVVERIDGQTPKIEKTDFQAPKYFPDLLKEMTRAQAGIVREFLNKKRSIDEIRNVVEDRIAKYDKKSKKGLESLFKDIKKKLEEDAGEKEIRKFINHILDELHTAWWNKDNKK